MTCPAHLVPLYTRFVAEEVTSVLRHDLRNKLAAIRNSVFYINRRVSTGTDLIERPVADRPPVRSQRSAASHRWLPVVVNLPRMSTRPPTPHMS